MILANANVLTMDERMPRASALAIAGGRVLGGVDSREDAIASHAHERVDLQGATVVPGFVDSHVHFRAWALSRVRVNLTAAASFDELLRMVREHAADLDEHAWMLGGGWRDDLLQPEGHDFGAAISHGLGDARPFALTSKDGHALLVNEPALQRLGLQLDQLDLPGGVVERTAAGSFTGVLREESAWAVRRRLPDDDLTTAAVASAVREASRRGVTCVHDMDGAAGLRMWRQLERERGLQLRVWQQLLARDLPAAAELGFGCGFGSDRLRIGAVKAFADGTLGSGTALLHEPELVPAGARIRRPVQITASEELTELSRDAAAAGFPLFVHAIGDAACTAVLDALELTSPEWQTLSVRPRVEHAQLMVARDITRAAQLGIVLSVQPSHLVEDRDLADARWGSGRTSRAFAFRTMVQTGAQVVLGSDAPIEDLHPLAALHAATVRDGGAHGLPPARGPWHPEQALDAETALRGCTSWAADAMGDGHRTGRLVPGREADLVVLSDDPTQTPIADIDVVATMVGGRWTYGAAQLG